MDFTFIWDINPELPFLRQYVPIRYYGLFFTGGLLAGYFLVKKLYEDEGLEVKILEPLVLYCYLGIIIGARLGHCLFYELTYFIQHPLEIFLPVRFLPDGIQFIGYRGLASHGGTIGVFLAIVFFCYRYKHPLLPLLDKIAIAGALTGCFIRLANFMNSEIIGIPTNGNYGIVFKQIDNIPRHPAQLYEAFFYLLIFFFLFYFYKRKQRKSGLVFGLLLVTLFTVRFLLEFVKINQVAFEEGMVLNMGQILSIPMILIGLGVIFWRK